MDTIIIHILLGIGLFFLINWIGKHSYTIGYMSLSLFVRREEAPALNLFIRVLSPVVYIIILSSILYSFNLDKYVLDIYKISIYYIGIRLLVNIFYNRFSLLNWTTQIFHWTMIILSSYFVYDKIIKVKKNILPDFSTLSNELWIIIIIFIYQIVNKLEFSQKGTERRKNNYLKNRYKYFKEKYHQTITDLIGNNQFLEIIVYSILIYEDFNRPKSVRYVENLRFKITKKEHSLGVMQVKTKSLISDQESVELGVKKILRAYNMYLQKHNLDQIDTENEYFVNIYIIMDYNNSYEYCQDVRELGGLIEENFYKKE